MIMYYTLCVTLPIERMKTLISILDKAEKEAKKKWMKDSEVLELRLIEDMLPFSKQIQIVSDNAKGTAARLSGKEILQIEDTESTIDELKNRLQKTISFLETFNEKDFKGAETSEARFPYFPDQHMIGEGYLLTYALPNFFFHMTTAYSILRAHGFDLGKKDYLPHVALIKDEV